MPFPPYWLDASVYITAKQTSYRFSTWPIFWSFLSQQLESGIIRSPKLVYQELVANVDQQDDLARWAKVRRGNGLRVSPSRQVQEAYGRIGDYLQQNPQRYPQPQVAEFLRGADAWLIAHAMADGGTVVTLETDLKPESHKVRIPDVCDHFAIRCINTSDMMEELGFSATG